MHASRQRSETILVIAWTSRPGRARAIAEELSASCWICYPTRFGARRSVVWRYAISLVLTVVTLLRVRPSAVVVQNPPVFPAFLSLCYIRLRGRGRLVMDAHPAAFGAKDNRQGRLFLWLTRWIAARASATLVTVEEYVDRVDLWGGSGVVLHEPPLAAMDRGVSSADPRSVFFACVYESDEPVQAVLDAAGRLPDVTFVFTGDPARSRVPMTRLPANVELTGYVPLARFLDLMAHAGIVLSLTSDTTSVARSAYEAVYLQRPLIVSDVPSMRRYFPAALAVNNDATSIVRAIQAIQQAPPSRERLVEAADVQTRRWVGQRSELLRAVSGEPSALR